MNLGENNSRKDIITKDIENVFCERFLEEADEGYKDENGFYRTPNGSFWDEQGEYFNHQGFDKHGGSYDKFGVYKPGPNYDEKRGIYKDEEDFIITPEDTKEINGSSAVSIQLLKDQEFNDRIDAKNINNLEEKEEEDNGYLDNTFDEEDIKQDLDQFTDIQPDNKGEISFSNNDI